MSLIRRRNLRLLVCAATALLAVACGGSGTEPAPATPPVVVVEPSGPGRLESAEQINRVPVAEIVAAVDAADSRVAALRPVYDVSNFRLTYLSSDAQGREIAVSALLSLPVKAAGVSSPVLAYQHATIHRNAEAPSNHAVADEAAVVLASLGYIVLAADYIGYGASYGTPHPYLLAVPSASVVVDLLTAAKTWRLRNGVADNGQLFMIGYSQGGHVTMAAHRALQSAASGHLPDLLAVVPGAGPYHVGATLDELLRRAREENPVLAALISPGLLRHLGSSLRRQVRDALLDQVRPADADVAFDALVIDHFLADDEGAIERDSNVHDWAPAAAVRLFHGRDDRSVPYASSERTLQAMLARAAPAVGLTDCTAVPSSHIGCVPEYFAFVLDALAPFARDL